MCHQSSKRSFRRAIVLIGIVSLLMGAATANPAMAEDNFATSRLVAWCIVPFDAKKRSPSERAAMIKDLGMQRIAYDWRSEHVPTFEEEILAYKKHGIEFFAFWSWNDAIEPLIVKHGIQPQIWVMLRSPKTSPETKSPDADQGTPVDDGRVARAAESILPLVQKTRRLGLKLGIYNHGNWSGEPENMVAVCKHLREHHEGGHVGIVYNFHHGHEHIDNFAASLTLMKPYLHCLNLNGMAGPETVQGKTNKILILGSGVYETKMIQEVIRQNYDGPIGILDHRQEVDAKESLEQNLAGLAKIIEQIEQSPGR